METSQFLAYESTSHDKYHNGLLSEKDFEWAVKLNRYSLVVIGLWPKSEQTTWKKRVCNLHALFVFSIMLFGIVIPGIHSMIRIRFDILLLTDNLQYTLPTVSCVLRYAIFWWKKEAVAPIVNMVADDWMKAKTPQEEATMIARAHIARIIIIFGYCIMGVSWVVVNILPIFGHSVRYLSNITDLERPLPLQTYYIYDTSKSPQYELTFTIQSTALVFSAMCYTGIDNFLSLSVFHISGQLDILRNRLMHLHNVEHYNVLKNCVMDHIRVFRAIDHIDDIFNIILMVLFLYFGILFAFYGFWMINMLESGQHLSIFHLVYILSVCMNTFGHMCLYCAVGEMLTTQCDRIHCAVYFNEWYTMDPKRARNLILLTIRTHKPLYLNIGKVFPLSMATFCNLLKTSAGYISVLLTTRTQSKM
ncbi:PREDICTED: odorant receptor 45b-like [Vollenhovia emeryi]|uniref:odorant receptor 45b-like n=1 Tax=Vollenhovia emeryi TaxID=411798 RepID=UPI0005F383D6|nr:PREDICTED: odorant receptor 45b-like [Vollenhovia emeryi]